MDIRSASRFHALDCRSFLPVALGARVRPFDELARTRGFVAIDHAIVHHLPRLAALFECTIFLQDPMRITHLVLSRREADVVALDDGRIETAGPQSEAAPA